LSGNCTIDRELGGGGMSRVFVATESALGREIVIKVLPAETANAVSVERFKREIAVVAKLQHPHIVPILSAGESSGLPFYTMPFVKGESLRARLAKGGELSVNSAVHILRDIASALAYAHEEGVVHRDIKPENVILSGGVAVVTDFGVAKAVDVSSTQSGHQPSGLTSLGVALGTPAYMAPEQASADPKVDQRADIYSFGCVAYEMLAGSSPFAGRPPQQILAAHVTEAPEPVLKRRTTVPPGLAALVMKCLEKRPGDRPQSAAELLAALDAIGTPSGGTEPTTAKLESAPLKPGRWRVAIGASLVVVVAVVAALALRGAGEKPLTVGATIPIAVGPDLQFDPAVSPDGKLVAFAASTPAGIRIFVRQIDGGRANMLTGELDGNHIKPRWSPDGSRISFARCETFPNCGTLTETVRATVAIYVVQALGGTPQKLVAGGFTHTWSPDGKQIFYQTDQGISVQPVEGGAAQSVVKGLFLHSPSVSPDGKLLAYVEGRLPAFDNMSTDVIRIVPVRGGKPVTVTDSTHTNVSPVWLPEGHGLLFVSSLGGPRDVYQQEIRSDGRPSGEPKRLTTGLSPFAITLSRDGARMAYDVVHNYTNVFVSPVSSGAPATVASARQVTREIQDIETVSLSRDGKWLAYDSDRDGNFDIYKLRLDGGDPVRLKTGSANDFAPRWSSNDSEIAFHSQRSGPRQVFVMSAEGNSAKQVTTGTSENHAPDWSPDGKQLAYWSDNSGTASISVVTRDAAAEWSKPRVVSDSENSAFPRWSPDGNSIAFVRAGAVAVLPSAGGPPRVVADRKVLGGTAVFVMWGRDASTLFVWVSRPGGRGAIISVPARGGTPRVILTDDAAHPFGRFEFDTDGSQIFFTRAAWTSAAWVMDLKR
jgi:Tol biopolymer transport system component